MMKNVKSAVIHTENKKYLIFEMIVISIVIIAFLVFYLYSGQLFKSTIVLMVLINYCIFIFTNIYYSKNNNIFAISFIWIIYFALHIIYVPILSDKKIESLNHLIVLLLVFISQIIGLLSVYYINNRKNEI